MLEPHKPANKISDKIALGLVKFFRFFADVFFQKRYGKRAVVLETIAAVPGMVGAAFLHFKCLRKIKNDEGWIKKLLEEADNERIHLMTFVYIAQPHWFERFIIFSAQIVFIALYSIMYMLSSETAHRFVGYLEEEAVASYTHYLKEVDANSIVNCQAPDIAKRYWHLPEDATLRDVIVAVRKDEAHHRDTNHDLADQLGQGFKILAETNNQQENRTLCD